jgi:hypothetical protein
MALSMSIHSIEDDDFKNHPDHTDDYDEEIDETEDDLIENYLYLTRRCGGLRHSPTTSALDGIPQRLGNTSAILARQFSWATDYPSQEYDRSIQSSKHRSSMNDFNNNCRTRQSSTSRIPPTIYYDTAEDDDCPDRAFSLVKLFARMKARMKHDRRYRADAKHELLHEEDPQEWFELTKNTREILTKALLPDGGYDALTRNYKNSHTRQSSYRKSRDSDPVLAIDADDDNDKILFDIDDTFGTENDADFDDMIWKQFVTCSRGLNYRRTGVCKAVDRQQFQGQLVYVYGVANNILIDENLKASGLG